MEKAATKIIAPSEEKGLWEQFKQGNEKALSTIYTNYFDHLYDYGFKLCKNRDLTEDSIQDLFVKLIRNKANLSTPESVKNYLFKAFRAALFDKLSGQNKYAFADLNETVEFSLEVSREEDIITRETNAAMHARLEKALQLLTPRQREAIFLRYQEGFSYSEVADILNLSQKAAYKLVARAIQALRSNAVTALLYLLFQKL